MDLGTCVLLRSGWRFPFLDRTGTVNFKHERVVRSSNSWPVTGKRCSTVKRGTMRSNSCLTSRFQSSQLRNTLMPCYFMINLSNTNANQGMDFLWNCSSCIFCAKGTPPCWVFQVFLGVVFLTASGVISPNVEAANDCNLRNVLDHYVFIMATLQGPFIMTIDLKIW